MYSFGVVLLELLSGQEPINTNPNRRVGPTMLVDDFSHLLQQWKLEELKVQNLADKSLCSHSCADFRGPGCAGGKVWLQRRRTEPTEAFALSGMSVSDIGLSLLHVWASQVWHAMQEIMDPILPANTVPSVQVAFYFELVAQCLQTQASKRFELTLIMILDK